MIPALRKEFNANFTKEKYEAFLKELHSRSSRRYRIQGGRNSPYLFQKILHKKYWMPAKALLILLLIQDLKNLPKMHSQGPASTG